MATGTVSTLDPQVNTGYITPSGGNSDGSDDIFFGLPDGASFRIDQQVTYDLDDEGSGDVVAINVVAA